MARYIDLTGKTFGNWTVIGIGPVGDPHRFWNCRCVCGTVRNVAGHNLRTGASTNCGCLREHVVKHGHATREFKTKTYRAWKAMRHRCSPGERQRKDYFDRGIAVCERWKEYENFLADMGECPDGLTLDRIDNDRGYFPGNCRWTDWLTQRTNSRHIRHIRLGKETLYLKEAAERIGVTATAVHQEAKRHGISHQQAFDRVRIRYIVRGGPYRDN